jgi:hypothetical protein
VSQDRTAAIINEMTLASNQLTPAPDGQHFGSRSWMPAPFRTIILYADLPSARNAMDRLARMVRHSQRVVVLHPTLWRFDQLNDPRWREMSLVDALDVGWIVFATRASFAIPAAASDWLTSVLARKTRNSTHLLMLEGDEEPWTVAIEHVGVVARSCIANRSTFSSTLPAETVHEGFARSA